MTKPEDPGGLLDFARYFLESRSVSHFSEVHTEELVTELRKWFEIPVFPTLRDLQKLCNQLGISLGTLPAVSDQLLALNGWHESGDPTVKLRAGLQHKRAEHSLAHEVREVLENAFKRVDRAYLGLDTNNNAVMNPESDHFASCLLMPAEGSRQKLESNGYDFSAFARETSRPLSSVIVRAKSLFSAKTGSGPVAGLWLFEAPWKVVESGIARAADLTMNLNAQLNGFSLAKGNGQAAQLARDVFPMKRSTAAEQPLVREAVEKRRTAACLLGGFDIFGEQDFVVAVEPLFARGTPWQALMTAVRLDCREMVRAWAERVDAWQLVSESAGTR